jgi:hypothetical protein
MAAQNELLAEAILEDKLVVIMLFQQLVVGTALSPHVCLLKFPQPAIHFAPPSWMFIFVYYACAVTTIRTQIAFVRRTWKILAREAEIIKQC